MSADLEKLLPCPFCGEPAKSYVSRDDDHDRYGEVCCTGCAASVRGPHLHWMDNTADEIASQFQAEMGWNRRTPAPAVPAEGLDALIDLIGEFGREVYYLLDDCETSGPVGEEVHTITDDGLMKVSALLDRIEALPFEEAGVILGPGAMLQAALKQTITALRSAPPVGARVSIPPGLIDALRSQRQIDADGCEVAVSRQACDEAAAILAALLPAGEGE